MFDDNEVRLQSSGSLTSVDVKSFSCNRRDGVSIQSSPSFHIGVVLDTTTNITHNITQDGVVPLRHQLGKTRLQDLLQRSSFPAVFTPVHRQTVAGGFIDKNSKKKYSSLHPI